MIARAGKPSQIFLKNKIVLYCKHVQKQEKILDKLLLNVHILRSKSQGFIINLDNLNIKKEKNIS